MAIAIVLVFMVLMLLFLGAVMILSYIGFQGWRHYLGKYLPVFNIWTSRWSDDPGGVRDAGIAEERRTRILNAIGHAGKAGATDAELADSIGFSVNTEQLHRLELVERGWVEDSGQRRAWAFGSDVEGTLWRLTDRGRAELNERSCRPFHEDGATSVRAKNARRAEHRHRPDA